MQKSQLGAVREPGGGRVPCLREETGFTVLFSSTYTLYVSSGLDESPRCGQSWGPPPTF